MKTNEFYCVKCKDKVHLLDHHIKCTTLKNKRPVLKGKCSSCKTNVCKFIKASDEQKMKSKFRSFKKSKKRSKSVKKSRSKKRSKSVKKFRSKSKKRSRSRK